MATPLQRKAIRFSQESQKRFKRALVKAASQIDDLTIPLNDIATRFLTERGFIFDMTRSGPGAYDDLSPLYKRRKAKELGSPYPILYYSGRLKASVTKRGGENTTIVQKKRLIIGSNVEYAEYLQHGTQTMPAREFLFWGPESPRFATNSLVRKQNLSRNVILFNYIQRKLGKTLDASIKKSVKEAQSLL